jgi:hypothetical protein
MSMSDSPRAPSVTLRDAIVMAPGPLLLMVLAATAFGQGAFSSTVQWFAVALIVLALALAVSSRALPVADLRRGFFPAGLLLAIWALLRAAAAGTPGDALSWVLFGAGTAAVMAVSRRLTTAGYETLLDGALAVGMAVAASGWLGVALHVQPWGLPDQGLWRAASTLTYANATAALLVPLALVALARLTAAPRSAYPCLAAVILLTGAGATLSRAGLAALAAGFLVLCLVLGARVLARSVAPVAGAGVALLGLVPSMSVAAPAKPLIAVIALASGLALTILLQRAARPALLLPLAGAAVAAGVFAGYRMPEVHRAIRTLAQVRFTLASSARSGEDAAALHIIARHPLAGVGPGRATLRWISPGGALNVDIYVHNEYLQVLTDLGIAGAVLTAIFMVTAGRLLWRRPAGHAEAALRAGAVAAVTAFLLHSAFDFIWQVPAIPLTVGAIVGLAARQLPGRPAAPLTKPISEREGQNAALREG